MKVRDKNVKQLVNVSDKECPKRECYWPRPDPGVFTQGVGYRTRYPGRKPEWLCGNREIRGCPAKYCRASNAPRQTDDSLRCDRCGNIETPPYADGDTCCMCGGTLRDGE